MLKRKDTRTGTKPTPATGSIFADEVLSLRELGRRLGLGKKSLIQMQRDGLRTTTFGKTKYVRGAWVHEFAER